MATVLNITPEMYVQIRGAKQYAVDGVTFKFTYMS